MNLGLILAAEKVTVPGVEFGVKVLEGSSKVNLQFDLLITTAFACLVVFLGQFFVKKVKLFRDWCFSGPVVGGIFVSVIFCILKTAGILEITWVSTLKNFCMDIFFTAVGFGASAALIKKGGKACIGIIITVCGLICMQNVVGIGLASVLGLDPILGLGIGSTAMSGGVGTAGAFGPIWEEAGVAGATVVSVAAGTIGMIIGSLIGGPTGALLIKKHNLQPDAADVAFKTAEENDAPQLNTRRMLNMACMLIIIAAIGIPIWSLLKMIPMIEMPYFIGCLFAGVIIRNVMDATGMKYYEAEISTIEHVMLDIFLALTLMTLDLTQLFQFAGPMMIILAAEALLMFLWAYFITYRLCGKNYQAAVMAAGHCGMGCGAGPNAVANEQAVMNRYGYAHLAWVIFPAFSVLVDDIWNPILISLLTGVFLK